MKTALIAKNVPQDKVIAFGMGEQHPIADNATEQGRMTNNRVEFFVSEDVNAE